ncbi:hypothetical protein L208DRAFT_1249202, partial [Tricholoma matsutake]
PGEIPQPFIVTKESSSIRSVIMDIRGNNQIESVINPGSSIISMVEDVCHKLGLAYDSSIRLLMQSANGTIDKMLGLEKLAHNMACNLGSIMLYMQIHVIWDPAYNILLRRPFDVLTESVIRNYRNEAQMIMICNLNSTWTATITLIP